MSLGVSKRRVQRLGGSSLIITLPKIWAKKVGIDIGDEVVVVDEGNHLRILPANSELVRNIGSINIKLANYVKDIDPEELARCAFISGYDRILIELPRSNGVNTQKILEELKKSDFVLEAVQVMNVIEAQLLSAKDGNRKFLKLVANILANTIEGVAREALSKEEAMRDYEKARMIIDILARSVFRNKVLTCSGENVNPMTVGIMYSLLANFQLLINELYETSGEDKEKIIKELSETLVLVASAAANTSGKRLLEILAGIEERMQRISMYNSKLSGIALTIMTSMKELARTTLCLTTTQYKQN